MVQGCSRRESGRIDSESLFLKFLAALRISNKIRCFKNVAEEVSYGVSMA